MIPSRDAEVIVLQRNIIDVDFLHADVAVHQQPVDFGGVLDGALQTAISDTVEMLKFMLLNRGNQAHQFAK